MSESRLDYLTDTVTDCDIDDPNVEIVFHTHGIERQLLTADIAPPNKQKYVDVYDIIIDIWMEMRDYCEHHVTNVLNRGTESERMGAFMRMLDEAGVEFDDVSTASRRQN